MPSTSSKRANPCAIETPVSKRTKLTKLEEQDDLQQIMSGAPPELDSQMVSSDEESEDEIVDTPVKVKASPKKVAASKNFVAINKADVIKKVTASPSAAAASGDAIADKTTPTTKRSYNATIGSAVASNTALPNMVSSHKYEILPWWSIADGLSLLLPGHRSH